MEKIIAEREMSLNLHTMKFEDYERIVKRYGYTGKVTETIIEEIS